MKKLWKKIKNLAKKVIEKFQDACIWIVKMVKMAMDWALENQEVTYVLVCGASLGWSAVKKIRKTKLERENDYQRTHIYDYSIGHHWPLRRQLTSDEMHELERRRRYGESMGDILESMRVLA